MDGLGSEGIVDWSVQLVEESFFLSHHIRHDWRKRSADLPSLLADVVQQSRSSGGRPRWGMKEVLRRTDHVVLRISFTKVACTMILTFNCTLGSRAFLNNVFIVDIEVDAAAAECVSTQPSKNTIASTADATLAP